MLLKLPSGRRVKRGVLKGGEDDRFICVNTHTRDPGKVVDEGERRNKVTDRVGRESEVIGSSPDIEVGFPTKAFQKCIVDEDKDQRRKGATLFDATVDGNQKVRSNRGTNPNIREEILNRLDDPGRETLLRKCLENESMVYRVKSLTVIREENEKIFLFPPVAVKLFVKRKNVIGRLTTG
jgi:hypothetical protein